MRHTGEALDRRVALPRAVQKCFPGKVQVTLRLRSERTDAGPVVTTVEQDGPDERAVACATEALQKDAVFRDALDGQALPVFFDIVVR